MKSLMFFVCCVLFMVVIESNEKIISPDEFSRMKNQAKQKTEVSDNSDEYFKPNSPYNKAIEAVFNIGIRLQLLLEQSEASSRNFLVSPLSMAAAVGQLMLGARGKLREYLADLVVFNGGAMIREFERSENSNQKLEEIIPLLDFHRQMGGLLQALEQNNENDNTFTLETASALFLQPGIRLNQLFEQSVYDFYHTYLVPVNFSTDPVRAKEIVNEWAVKNTHGRIKSILSEPLPKSSAAVLANAVYFKADWQTPFSFELSTKALFRISPTNNVSTIFLRGQFEIPYVDSHELNCTMIVLPYKYKKMGMYVVLPKVDNGREFSISQFTTKLRSKDIYELIKQTQQRTVTVSIPKMTLSNTISLLDPLKKYSAYKTRLTTLKGSNVPPSMSQNRFDLLDEKIEIYKELTNDTLVIDVTKQKDPVDLSGASTDSRFKLSDIVQQMSLAINEKGTEAAAITASTIEYSGGNKMFKADRPFLFFIRHEITEAILFWGTIVQPF